MTEQKEYAIIRFFEQGDQCHKVDDVAEGKNLLQFIKDEEKIDKKEMYLWFSSLANQLMLYHKSLRQAYGHVNPYTVIVKPERQIALLDIEAKENEELVKRMQKKNFRTLFVKDSVWSSHPSELEEDVFGFGKLLLFVMEKGKFVIDFTKLEQIKIKRIVEKCTKKDVEAGITLKKVQKELNAMQKRCGRSFPVIKIIAGTSVILIFCVGTFAGLKIVSMKEEKAVIQEAEASNASGEEKERLALELGMLYYAELKDYESATEVLCEVEEISEAADIYLRIIDYIQSGSDLSEEQWECLWENLKEEWVRLGVENKLWYKMPVLEACKIRNTPESCNIICEIGEDAKRNRLWNGIADDSQMEILICRYLGEAYEALEDEERALVEYESWKELETENEQLEKLYLKILSLNENLNDGENEPEVMRKILDEAILKVPGIEENVEFCEWMEKYTMQEETAVEESAEDAVEEVVSEAAE